MNKKKEIAADHEDDVDEVSQDLGSESSGMFVRQEPAPNRKEKQVQNVRIPKVAKTATMKKAGPGNQGKGKRAVRIAKTAVDEEEDFGRTESQ